MIEEAARSLVGIPWVHQGRTATMAAGVDCIGQIVEVGRIVGRPLRDSRAYSRQPNPRTLLRGIFGSGLVPVAVHLSGIPGDLEQALMPATCALQEEVVAQVVPGLVALLYCRRDDRLIGPMHAGILGEAGTLIHTDARVHKCVEIPFTSPHGPEELHSLWAYPDP